MDHYMNIRRILPKELFSFLYDKTWLIQDILISRGCFFFFPGIFLSHLVLSLILALQELLAIPELWFPV